MSFHGHSSHLGVKIDKRKTSIMKCTKAMCTLVKCN